MINGIPAPPGWFTFMAAISWTTPGNDAPTSCSGFVVSPTAIISAGHCIHASSRDDTLLAANYSARLGSPYRKAGQLVQLKAILHPLFNHKTLENDISILKPYVDGEQLPMMNCIKPAFLPDDLPRQGTEVYAMGWGKTTFADCIAAFGHLSPVLLYDKQRIWNILRTQKKIHVKGFNYEDTGTATCLGDSGGPLVEVRGGMSIAIGILSRGDQYGTETYQQIAPHRLFILAHAPDAQFV